MTATPTLMRAGIPGAIADLDAWWRAVISTDATVRPFADPGLKQAVIHDLDGEDTMLAPAALEQMPQAAGRIGHLREQLLEWCSGAHDYAFRMGEDPPEIRDWQWPCGAADAVASTS